MNLTYDGATQYSGANSCEVCSACHYAAASALTSPKVRMEDYVSGEKNNSPALSGFFQDLASTVKNSFVRTNLFPITLTKALVQGGPSGAVQALKNEGHAAAGDIAPIGKPIAAVVSVFNPLIGGAIGAATAAAQVDVARQKAAASTVNAKQGDNQALISEYAKYAGQVPGRAFGLDNMVNVLNAAFATGSIPPSIIDDKGSSKIWGDMAKDFIFATGGNCVTSKYKCPPGMLELAKANPSASADQIVSAYLQSNPYQAKSMDDFARVIFRDVADAALAQVNPNADYTYGVDMNAAQTQNVPATTSTPPSVPVNVSPVLTATAQPNAPQYIPRATNTITAAGVDPATSAAIATMLQNMQQQGANQQQMQNAMLQALANQGVNTQTPQIQSATQAAVAPLVSTAGISGLPTWLALAGGVVAVLFAFAIPRRDDRPASRAFSSRAPRRRNPRRRRYSRR